MRAFTGGETAYPRYRGPKSARTAQKISSVSLTIDEIRFRMRGATVYEISRLEADVNKLEKLRTLGRESFGRHEHALQALFEW